MGRNMEERRGVDKGMKETKECKNVDDGTVLFWRW
jgi:hypothetical protein